MGLMEIGLIILGAIILILGYVLPAGKGGSAAETGVRIDEELIRGLVEREAKEVKNHLNDMVDETVAYSMEKTERAMERLTNEKIMAINEYSEQVMEGINKNHQEVIFLYDMLNDKHDTFVKTVGEANRKMKEIKQEVQDIEITVKEFMDPAKEETEEGKKEKNATEAERQASQAESGFVPFSPERVEVSDQVARKEKENTSSKVSGQKKEENLNGEEQSRNNNEKILRLHKLGKSETAIAKDLGLGVGEVKLVIDLFEQAK